MLALQKLKEYAATDRTHDAVPTHPCGIPTGQGGCGK